MRPVVLLLLMATLLGGSIEPSSAAPADGSRPPEPIAVVCLAGYNALMADLAYVGRLSGFPGLADRIEMFVNLMTGYRGLRGLDRERPWGAALLLDEERLAAGETEPERVFRILGFVPVTNGRRLLDTLRPYLGEVERVDDNLYRLGGWVKGQTLFARLEKDWIFLAATSEALDQVPEDPGELLADLAAQYDVAARIRVANLPPPLRPETAARIRREVENRLKQQPGESVEIYLVRKRIADRVYGMLDAALSQLEEITIGCSLDQVAEKFFLDVGTTARPETEAAAQFERSFGGPDHFAGFRTLGAMLSGNAAVQLDRTLSFEMVIALELIRQAALEQITSRATDPQRAEIEKRLLRRTIDAARNTVAEGRIDHAAAVVLEPDGLTLVVAAFVADENDVDRVLEVLAEAARNEGLPLRVELLPGSGGESDGIRFHKVALPVSDAGSRVPVAALVGQTLEVVVGVDRKKVYVALGRRPMEVLEKLVGASQPQPQTEGAPLTVLLDAASLARLLAELGEQSRWAAARPLVQQLQAIQGDAQIHLTTSPLPRGIRFRLEAQRGILEALGAWRMMAPGPEQPRLQPAS